MRRLSGLDSGLTPEMMDPNSWAAVDTSHLSSEDLDKYKQRKRAVSLYLSSDLRIDDVIEQVGISRSELYRLIRRALKLSPDGYPWGLYALLPKQPIEPYTRTSRSGRGRAGLFTQFLSAYPELEQALVDFATGKRKIHGKKIRGRHFKMIWKAFKKLCDEAGIDSNTQYPFTNKDHGREAVRRYCHSIRARSVVRGTAAEFGVQAGRLAATATMVSERNRVPYRPYEEVQLDAHKIDGLFVISLLGADGEWHDLILDRIWLLVLLDCGSRAALGYSISLKANYTTEDVINCIVHSLVPWQPLIMPSERICYKPGSGFPSGVISECAWRAFDILRFDNAYAHRSPWLKQQVLTHIANEIISNRGQSPRSDAFLERLFRTFEEVSFHQWPNTTGSEPADPRRDRPEENAKRFHIDFEDLRLASDLALASYNVEPHAGLNERSPLGYLRYRIERNLDFVRKVEEHGEDHPLFYRDYTVTIRGSRQQGHLPYVQWKYAKYTNESLCQSYEHVGEKATLRIHIGDARDAELFAGDGRSLGRLRIEYRWSSRAHTLGDRASIRRLMRVGRLPSDSDSPLDDYLQYIEARARTSKRARNELLHQQQREQNAAPSSSRSQSQLPAKPKQSTRGWISLAQAYSR